MPHAATADVWVMRQKQPRFRPTCQEALQVYRYPGPVCRGPPHAQVSVFPLPLARLPRFAGYASVGVCRNKAAQARD